MRGCMLTVTFENAIDRHQAARIDCSSYIAPYSCRLYAVYSVYMSTRLCDHFKSMSTVWKTHLRTTPNVTDSSFPQYVYDKFDRRSSCKEPCCSASPVNPILPIPPTIIRSTVTISRTTVLGLSRPCSTHRGSSAVTRALVTARFESKGE